VPYAELFDSFRNINFLYPEKKLLSSGLQGWNICQEQDILPADFGKISH
jgi:hypothetical protein